jgi:hypothetical protein
MRAIDWRLVAAHYQGVTIVPYFNRKPARIAGRAAASASEL